MLTTGRHFDAAEAWNVVETERVTSMVIVGDAFARPLLQELDEGRSRDISSLRVISSAGATFSAELKSGLLAHMSPEGTIYEYVSSTEAAMGVAVMTRDTFVDTGSFKPNPGVILIDEDGRPLAIESDRPGRIAVPAVARGYLNDETKTAETFLAIDSIRYAVPGDYAVRGQDGTFKLLGRGSTCINTGGLKVFPDEVEEALRLHPAVKDAVVVGLPDDRFGQRVTALVSLTDGAEATEEDILASVRGRLAGYKIPRLLKITDVVPRNNIGKHDYSAARRILEQ